MLERAFELHEQSLLFEVLSLLDGRQKGLDHRGILCLEEDVEEPQGRCNQSGVGVENSLR